MDSEFALVDLLYKMADDQLILGHRNSEWTGIGPLLEEDIAFSSMAQDKLGHSLALYQLLHELGEADPDTLAFMRNANQFHCCHLVELPIGDYAFSLMRHFLFDNAELLRFEALTQSTYEPLAKVAVKLKSELKYHVLHANTLIRQLGTATPESTERLQKALEEAWPYALGIFEESIYEEQIISSKLFIGEVKLKQDWLAKIETILGQTNLKVPIPNTLTPALGGRMGQHTPYLQALLNEMTEVYNIDPNAEW
ncbi:1,2-phenylacetyl-CoA epoxidase subunit PaaC [Adhaeribacter radiodurans]|uniref:Phenylacetate-CoA oxygenase subunit PaaC n=1 Tax=Adhaeribacter radiodurans TaxID=2745197 RepID=A0A7L7L9H9_9BACT|nr:1,2-phenylacetyl-CoA epoxidase subunit PaaC [Adhaeribacter radiodurans]QMU29185.1 phenylacetate-CoA oxygenase subunit PaaC [Adhaeribacter radiodurans]